MKLIKSRGGFLALLPLACSGWQIDFIFKMLRIGTPATHHPQPTRKWESLQIIGAGLPRTGTDSLRAALRELGYHTYHVESVTEEEGHMDHWKALFEATVRDSANLESALDSVIQALSQSGYNATTDSPACFLVPELAERYPKAKIILGVRDSAETWADSFGKTVGLLVGLSKRFPFRRVLSHSMGPLLEFYELKLGGAVGTLYYGDTEKPVLNTEVLPTIYNGWLDHVQRLIPKERLLLHNSKDGWEPLCQFLEVVDCPQGQYPNMNDRSTFVAIVAVLTFIADYWSFLLIFFGIMLMWSLRRVLFFDGRKLKVD